MESREGFSRLRGVWWAVEKKPLESGKHGMWRREGTVRGKPAGGRGMGQQHAAIRGLVDRPPQTAQTPRQVHHGCEEAGDSLWVP